MKKERLKVLEMLESGKINVEEAAKLLEALKVPDAEQKIFEVDEVEENLNKFSQSVDTFAKECGDKLGSAYKEMEPKLKNLTKTVIEKTVNVIDEISKSLNESLKNLNDEKSCNETENKEDDDDVCRDNGPAPEEVKEAVEEVAEAVEDAEEVKQDIKF